MNYINILTREEKSILCGIITGKEFRKLFRKYEKEFVKIQKGFRAKSLTEQRALSIATINVDKPFITIFINNEVEKRLEEIQNNIESLEREGLAYDNALATTMLDSVFANCVELYLKLIGSAIDMDARSKLYENMQSIQLERSENEKIFDQIGSIEEEKKRLLDQIEIDQQRINTIQEEYEQKIQEIEHDKNVVESSLKEAQERITELQDTSHEEKCEAVNYFTQYDDTKVSVLPSAGSDEIISLCSVISDYSGQKWLIRYADLSRNGHYYIFHKNEDMMPYFANRDKIFYRDGPSEDDFYGIWTWSAIPNAKDPSKDYISSEYNRDLNAIEVIFVLDVTELNDLVDILQKGFECLTHSYKTMFAFYTSKGQYTGILCKNKELNTVDGKIYLSEECIEVPVYEFGSGDILHLDNGLSFYKNAFAGLPNKLYQLKSPLDIVKNIVFDSISWTTYKTRGVTRAGYRNLKDLIGAIQTDDIITKIEKACHCSNVKAKELLNEFLKVVWKYIDGDCLEDEIILSAIYANNELQEKTKEFIRADWEKENKSLLADVQKKFEAYKMKLNSAAVSLSETEEMLNRTKLEKEQLERIIAEKKKLAEDVEIEVAERIRKARENAADFIANMAFVGGQEIYTDNTKFSKKIEELPKPIVIPYRTCPMSDELSNLDIHHSWKEVIDTVIFEFGEAGVTEKYRSGLATFLCAAYIEKQPIFLIGPNAIDIAQAFIAAVAGSKCGILYCEGSYRNEIIKKIGVDDEDIVIINNLLASGWMNRLPEILSKKDIFYIITHPYAEDIQVEPKSLYGFALPLFTEFFVDKKATGKYYGGYFAQDFPKCLPLKNIKKLRVLYQFSLNSLIKNQINRLIALMQDICSETTIDDKFLFAVFPVAYASMEIKELKEVITDPLKGMAISESLKRDLQDVLGEI